MRAPSYRVGESQAHFPTHLLVEGLRRESWPAVNVTNTNCEMEEEEEEEAFSRKTPPQGLMHISSTVQLVRNLNIKQQMNRGFLLFLSRSLHFDCINVQSLFLVEKPVSRLGVQYVVW